jgi:hypothetical protein
MQSQSFVGAFPVSLAITDVSAAEGYHHHYHHHLDPKHDDITPSHVHLPISKQQQEPPKSSIS